jgi:hypothetical protein
MLHGTGRQRPAFRRRAFGAVATAAAILIFYVQQGILLTQAASLWRYAWWDGAPGASLQEAGAAVQRTGQGLNIWPAKQVFASFVKAHHSQLEDAWRKRLKGAHDSGIVIAAGHPASLANAFVNLSVLRHLLKSSLPATVM